MLRRVCCTDAFAARLLPTQCSIAPYSAPCVNKNLIGNASRGKIEPIVISWTDIISEDTGGSTKRLSAGSVLSMMDMCAARASSCVANHVTRNTGVPYFICTVGVTNTTFAAPILYGDAVRMRGSVIYCGESSLGIYIRFFRQSPTTREESLAGESFFTMVTITSDLKAAKIVPAIELTDEMDIAMHNRYISIRFMEKKNSALCKERAKRTLTVEEVECPINQSKIMHVPISSTHCRANRIFFSSHLNNNNTIFGGELMAWMERHAAHCGRMLTGKRHIYTIGMHNLSFCEPVFATDWVSLDARVIYVRHSTMVVNVTLTAERENGMIITNSASFVLINNNDIGQKAKIPFGIDLSKATQEELRSYMEAKIQYDYCKEDRKNFNNLVEHSLMI